ncbi:MAG: hypothetical protein ACJ71Z_05760 [Aeromicrobium sp.]
MRFGRTRRARTGVALIFTIGASFAVAGCGTRPLDLAGACPKLDASTTVPTCTELFDGKVGLKLPATSSDAPVGAVSRGGEFFVSADGTKVRMQPLKLPMSMSTYTAYATTIYRAKVEDGIATGLKPVLRVSEGAILEHTFGSRVLTGVISPRTADGSYDMRPKLPVVMQLASRARGKALPGTIVNATSGARLPDGRCVPPLPSGAENPLVDGFAATVTLERVPSMHVTHDDEMILAWNDSSSAMGRAFYPSVATVLGHDPLGKTWDVVQHGTPNSGPALTLRLGDGPTTPC